MKQFEAGQSYFCRSICDYGCVWTYKVVRRSASSVWLTGEGIVNKRFAIKMWDDEEVVKPQGTYSMSPTLRASNKA